MVENPPGVPEYSLIIEKIIMNDLKIFAAFLEGIYIPLALIVLCIGLLAYIDAYYVPQLIQILPVEEWPKIFRTFY